MFGRDSIGDVILIRGKQLVLMSYYTSLRDNDAMSRDVECINNYVKILQTMKRSSSRSSRRVSRSFVLSLLLMPASLLARDNRARIPLLSEGTFHEKGLSRRELYVK